MSNKVYDVLKTIAEIIIPAIATIYWILSEYLGIAPNGETVIGILIAIDTCLGSILAYCSYEYDEEESSDGPGDSIEEEDGAAPDLDITQEPENEDGDPETDTETENTDEEENE